MSHKNNTKALAGRNPANSPKTHGIMTPEFFNEASTYRQSLDRQGMNLATSNGSKFGNVLAEDNDGPSDVSDAINGYAGQRRGYGRGLCSDSPSEKRVQKDLGPGEYPSGCHMKGYGR